MPTRRILRPVALVLGLGLGASSAGCDPFTELDFTPQTDVPVGAELSWQNVQMVEGRAVGFLVTPMAGSDPMDESDPVELATRDARIVGIDPTFHKRRSFVLFGVAKGETSIEVTVNGNFEGDIPVTITEAP